MSENPSDADLISAVKKLQEALEAENAPPPRRSKAELKRALLLLLGEWPENSTGRTMLKEEPQPRRAGGAAGSSRRRPDRPR